MESMPASVAFLELAAALGGSYAFYKLLGPFIYQECLASADDEDVRQLEAGLFPPVTERSPLLGPNASPRPNSIRLALQLYNAHISASTSPALSSRSISTPPVSYSGQSTPVSTAPSTPVSQSSSYFDLKHPPLYVKDVAKALEKETKRRTSAEFQHANFASGFALTPAESEGARTPGSIHRPAPFLTMTRRFSNPASAVNRTKPFSDETSYLTASLICLLHSRDLNDFFISGKYLEEDIQDKQHQAVINAYAAIAQYFWPNPRTQCEPAPALDLSIFQALFKKTPSVSSSPSPLSSSPNTRPPSPLLSSSSLSSPSTLVNPSPSAALSGAQTVSHLLRSLHFALNEGEYTAEQPTYLREPFRLGRGKQSAPDDEEGLRRHVGFLRNMKLIQEDSVVRDLFEGLCCSKVRCCGCDETVVSFESFLVLPLPANATRTAKLSSLLKAYEKSSAPSMSYCTGCRSYKPHTETRKVWSLPSVLILQLPTGSTSPAAAANSTSSVALSSSSRTTNSSPPAHIRRMSFSAPQVSYPLEGLNMSKYNGEQQHETRSHHVHPHRSTGISIPRHLDDEYDLSSDSGDSDDDDDEEDSEDIYDLFAVRESLRTAGGSLKYRAYARGAGGWTMFDAGSGTGREVTDLREVVTPNADLLFYRRREA